MDLGSGVFAIVLALIAKLALDVRPTERNVSRAVSRIVSSARRRNQLPVDAVAHEVRVARAVYVSIVVISVIVFAFTAYFAYEVSRLSPDVRRPFLLGFFARWALLGAVLVLAGIAERRWAPVLYERARLVLEARTQTTKEPASMGAPAS